MRGVPNPEMGSAGGHLQNVLGDLVQVTSVYAPMLRTFGNMRVSAFHARGGSLVLRSQISLRSSLTVWHTFTSMAFSQTRRTGRHVWRDCSPSSLHSRKPQLPSMRTSCKKAMYNQRNTCRRHWKISSTRISRFLHRICRSRWLQSLDEITPPAPIADFPS